MREMKFRGKRIDNGEWVFGYLVRMFSEIGIMPFDEENTFNPIIPETVEQYTGLKDKNGREIYEGDIVFWEDEHFYKGKSEVVYCVDRYNYPAFDLANHDYEAKGLQCVHEECFMQVIGNIHDNPELLEENKQ